MPSEDLSLWLFLGLGAGGALLLLATAITLVWLVRTRETLARVVGLELLSGLTAGVFVVLGIWQGSTFYVEVALLLGLLGFIATIAYARLGASEEEDPS